MCVCMRACVCVCKSVYGVRVCVGTGVQREQGLDFNQRSVAE